MSMFSPTMIQDPNLTPEEEGMSKYQQLDITLHDKRFKPPKPMDSRKVGSNCYLERSGEDINVRLYHTIILTFRPNGTVTLNAGGWTSQTTKYRMNSFLGDKLSVYSNNGSWYIDAKQTETMQGNTHWRNTSETIWTHTVIYPFHDGMSFDVETGLLVWNPYTWTPMEYVDGMFSAGILNRLAALESALEEAMQGRRELTTDFINECLQRRESVETNFTELRRKLEREVKGIEWRMETTLERTMKAFQSAAETKAHEEKVKRLGWCSLCSEFGHSDDSPHQTDMEGGVTWLDPNLESIASG